MKRWMNWVFVCLAVAVCSGCYNTSEDRQAILKVYNWADYIGEGVLEDFQQYYKEQTGEDIRIVYQTFDINEIMLTKIEKGHEDFDRGLSFGITSSSVCCARICCCRLIRSLHIRRIT